MKKMLIMIVIIAISKTPGRAQNFAVNFSAGATLATMHSEFAGEKDHSNARVGFTTGIGADIAMSKNFSFQPALNFVQKGGQETDSDGGNDTKYSVTANYLEVPLNLVYKTTGTGARFFLGAGPTFAYGIGGKQKVSDNNGSISAEIKFGSNETDDLKPLDIGANFLMGVQFNNGLNITGTYNLGINNLSPEQDLTLKNRYIGIRAGYMLYMKKSKK